VTGTLADRFPADLHLFTNYQRPADILGLREELPLGLSTARVCVEFLMFYTKREYFVLQTL
jgi:hypothetical protein